MLGVLWSVLNPLLMMLVMSFVFSRFLRSSAVENYPLYLIVGNITFALMNEATSTGLRSIIDAAPLLKKIKIDRWVFPIQKVLSAIVNFLFSMIAVVVVMLFSQTIPSIHILWMLYALFFLMLFCVGVSLCIGSLAVFFRDLIHLWSVLMVAWTYLTPIFWDLSLLVNANAGPLTLGVITANPMYAYLEIMRSALVYGQNPTSFMLISAAAWAVGACLVGMLVFKKTEHKFILFI